MKSPSVIFIGGHGRSGTTIVDRVLSELIGAFSAGEVHRFWKYGLARDWTCSCREPLRDCAFWGDVLQQSFSEFDCSEEDVLEAWRSVARPRSILPLCFPFLRTNGFQSKLSLYRSFLRVFYRAVAEHSGKETIVDSSGSPFHGYILSELGEVEVTMIHLIRDARAVAFSNRKKKPNPSDPRSGAEMRRKLSLRVCFTWVLFNSLFERLSEKFDEYCQVKYESVFENPKREFTNIAHKIEVKDTKIEKFLSGSKIKLGDGHIGQGNPVRYKRGVIKLEPDTDWKKNMSNVRKKTVKMFCNYTLGKYDYN